MGSGGLCPSEAEAFCTFGHHILMLWEMSASFDSIISDVREQDQILKSKTNTKTKTRLTIDKTGLSYHGCSYNTRTAHHQNSFLSVYLKDCCT